MRLAVALILTGALLGILGGLLAFSLDRERQVRADAQADVCELRDAVIDVLVLARASDGDSGFYDLSIARLHRIECP